MTDRDDICLNGDQVQDSSRPDSIIVRKHCPRHFLNLSLCRTPFSPSVFSNRTINPFCRVPALPPGTFILDLPLLAPPILRINPAIWPPLLPIPSKQHSSATTKVAKPTYGTYNLHFGCRGAISSSSRPSTAPSNPETPQSARLRSSDFHTCRKSENHTAQVTEPCNPTLTPFSTRFPGVSCQSPSSTGPSTAPSPLE